jgi:hypothetical protein
MYLMNCFLNTHYVSTIYSRSHNKFENLGNLRRHILFSFIPFVAVHFSHIFSSLYNTLWNPE